MVAGLPQQPPRERRWVRFHIEEIPTMAVGLDAERRQGMGGHPMPKMEHVFSDHLVTATDLNRRGGGILDIASRQPVTITRNDQQFALLRRELAAQLYALNDQASRYTEVMKAIQAIQSGKVLDEGYPYRWLHVYGVDDLTQMFNELLEAFADVVHGTDSEAVGSVIHEWYESAIAAESEALYEAFEADPEPVPLTVPTNDKGTVEA